MSVGRRVQFAALLLLAGAGVSCSGPQSILHPGGPAARNLSQIGWAIFIGFGIISVFMWVLLLWAALRKKGSLETHEPWDTGGGQSVLLIFGFAIPFLVLAGVFGFALEKMADFPIHGTSSKPDIVVIGHQWWWEVRYVGGPPNTQFTTANEIHIPVGRPVEIALLTNDVIHSFWVPAIHGKVDMIPGQENYIRIQADHAGEFKGQCAEYCGAEHARMRLLVVADPPAKYQQWLLDQLKPAAAPTNEIQAQGEQVFLTSACAYCHRVRGTPAAGLIGPDLTHLASRKNIGANSYLNDKADLGGWVTHAQTMKPAALMPNLTEYNGRELRALVEYLSNLK